jgi:hypothetical protein
LADVDSRVSGYGVDCSTHSEQGIDHILDPATSFSQEGVFSPPQITNIEIRAINNEAEG